MSDFGAEIAYTALTPGTPVRARSGEEIGTTEHVLADVDADIFDGVIIDVEGVGAGRLFADAEQVAGIHERAVLLAVDREQLHEPSANPASLSADPADTAESELTQRLRRAWDWISGRY